MDPDNDPGRLRGRALAPWRKARAVELSKDGLSYGEIARRVGYAHRGNAHRAVQSALGERLVDAIDELREVEGRRLESIQHALWPVALDGDLRAAEQVLRVMDARMRLFALYKVVSEPDRPRTLILPRP